MTTKTCTCCGEELALSEFAKDGNSSDGLKARCRGCRSMNGVRYTGRERKQNREFSRAMAALPVFELRGNLSPMVRCEVAA
jgi:hypothetical protein